MPTDSHEAFPTPGHDHHPCMAEALARAHAAFAAKQMRLTDLRRIVFEEIAASHGAVGAYDVLDKLARKGTRLAPISIYRALDALLEAGVVHRLERRNAYFACHAAHGAGSAQVVLECSSCGIVGEVEGDSVFKAIQSAAARTNFQASASIVEVTGLCGNCA
jgi:Fur family zinc uptake transcriptional regulator